MRQCRSELTLDMHTKMKEALPLVAECYLAQGFVTESELDHVDVISVNDQLRNQKPKDERVLHQQRAVIMNYTEVSERYRAYQEQKRLKADQLKNRTGPTPKKKGKVWSPLQLKI